MNATPISASAPDPGHSLILGLGETGLAAARWCARAGERLRLADTRAQPPGLKGLGELGVALDCRFGAAFEPGLLDGVTRMVLSPGLAPTAAGLAELLAAAQTRGVAVVNEVELFAQALAALRTTHDYAPQVLAVTGTNGKTTVAALTRHLLAACGVSVRAVGNISPAALAGLMDALAADDLPAVWVLELSSFQLVHLHSLAVDAGALLNLSQDHLDWHGDMSAYAQAKARLLAASRVRIVNRDDAVIVALALARAQSADLAGAQAGEWHDPSLLSFGAGAPPLVGDMGVEHSGGVAWLAVGEPEALDEPLAARRRASPVRRKKDAPRARRAPARVLRMMPADALRLRGAHNGLNAQAALLLARSVGLPWHRLLPALRDYAGEPHRMALVRSIGGVDFIDDSKGTNVGATVAALAGGEAPAVLIAGGLGKGQDFAPLAAAVARYARAVVLIGQDAELIAQALAEVDVPCVRADSLEAAVERAYALAQPGQAVLLSPACASMDMFCNYVARGLAFAQAVHALALAHGEVA